MEPVALVIKIAYFLYEDSLAEISCVEHRSNAKSGPEVLFKTCVAMKFVVDDDDDDNWASRCEKMGMIYGTRQRRIEMLGRL